MSQPTSPSWYDVLGVERTATPAEIKAAWRQATDKFEPGSGSGQFKMFSEAADVLLDPDRRAAYDATLDPSSAPPPTAPATAPAAAERESAVAPESESEPEVARARAGGRRLGGRRLGGRRLGGLGRVGLPVLAVLALLVVAAVAGAAVLGVKAHQQAQVSEARAEAPAAAERAVAGLFAYDYRKLDADRKRAQSYLAPSFAKTYLRNFDALEKQKDGSPGLAVQTKAVVTTNVQGSGLVDVNDDGTLARVLVFVNLVSQKAEGDPQIFQNRVAMTMVKDGDRWLVQKVDSY